MQFLIRLLILVGIGYLLYKLFSKGERLFKSSKKPHPQKRIEEMKKDPVCGTYIPENEAVTYKAHGQTFYFCSQECKEKYKTIKNS